MCISLANPEALQMLAPLGHVEERSCASKGEQSGGGDRHAGGRPGRRSVASGEGDVAGKLGLDVGDVAVHVVDDDVFAAAGRGVRIAPDSASHAGVGPALKAGIALEGVPVVGDEPFPFADPAVADWVPGLESGADAVGKGGLNVGTLGLDLAGGDLLGTEGGVEAAAERDSAQEAAEVGVGGAVVRSGHGDLFFDLFIGGDSEGPGGDGQGDEGEEGGELHGGGF